MGEAWLGRVCNGRGEPLDGGPPVLGSELREIGGCPINPAARATPGDPILTGVSVVDGLATLVRGQKLPIFSVGGLPHLELAAQIAAQATVRDEPFAVVFAAMGVTNADAAAVRERLEARASRRPTSCSFLNTADDPIVERITTPRVALTVAEHLAFDRGRHVLVVMADMTSYCEAVREVASARGEIPSRRGYPGYLYSDLASLYERAGRIRGGRGSLTQVPGPDDAGRDITHPVPDLTGYITEGQIVLSHELHVRGVYPPFDPLRSLSRLMRLGAGAGKTRADHLEIAAQLYALVARGPADRRPRRGRRRRRAERGRASPTSASSSPSSRSSSTRDRTSYARSRRRSTARWQVASLLPRRELTMLSEEALAAHYVEDGRWRSGCRRVGRGASGSCAGSRSAARGADVLDQKRRTLLRERLRTATALADAAAAWEREARLATQSNDRALALAGERRLRLGAVHCRRRATAEVTWRNMIGTVIPTEVRVDTRSPRTSSRSAAAPPSPWRRTRTDGLSPPPPRTQRHGPPTRRSRRSSRRPRGGSARSSVAGSPSTSGPCGGSSSSSPSVTSRTSPARASRVIGPDAPSNEQRGRVDALLCTGGRCVSPAIRHGDRDPRPAVWSERAAPSRFSTSHRSSRAGRRRRRCVTRSTSRGTPSGSATAATGSPSTTT